MRKDDGGPALDWIVGDDTGISSKNIWRHMMGVGKVCAFSPRDPADFGRCARLLALVPSWRDRIGEMARYGRDWAAIAARWSDVHDCMAGEVGIDWSKGCSAPKTYQMMQEIYADAMLAAREGGKP